MPRDFTKEEDKQPNVDGDIGEVCNLSDRTAQRIERQALKQRWEIPEKYKPAIINRQVQIAIDPKSSNRESTSAAKALLSMESQNQKDEHKVVDVSLQARNIELDELAADLGIEADLIVDGTATGSVGDSGIEADTAEE